MRRLGILLLLLAAPAFGQLTTAVTAHIVDPNGTSYVNCSWSVIFVGENTTPGAGPYAPASLLSGQQAKCDASGNLSVNLADNINTVTPTPSQWQFNICSAQGYVGGPFCFQQLVTITGTTQNISSQLNAVAPLIPLPAGGTAGGTIGNVQTKGSTGVIFGEPGTIYADQFTGADMGAKVNAAVASSSCVAPQGCVIRVPAGSYSYSTPIVVAGSIGPITLVCDPGGSTGGNTYGTLLNYTPTSGTAFTWGAGENGGGLNGCQIKGTGAGNSAIGLYISTIQGGLFSNVEIQGFGTGMKLNTTGGQVYINTFNNFYVHSNTTNLLAPANDGVTNENITFNGGYFTGDSYNPSCMNLANFEFHFNYVSFDSCPIVLQGGANSHFSFLEDHFEFTKGATGANMLVVAAGCSACEVTVIDPEIIEDTAGVRTEFVTIAGSGTYTFVAPQVFATESVSTFITVNNSNAQILVENPFYFGAGTISASITGTSGSGTVVDHGKIITNNNLLLISPVTPLTSGLSGFGTSPAITSNSNGMAAFTINVGTGGSASSGTVTVPASPTGWNCSCTDISTVSSTVFQCRATPGSPTTIAVANYNTSGSPAAWTASDIIDVSCFAR